MADNGRAPGFNDRRGTNPFQPVAPVRPKVRTEHARPVRPEISYNGQGQVLPNGVKPTTTCNGMAFPRENPNVRERTQRLMELGEVQG